MRSPQKCIYINILQTNGGMSNRHARAIMEMNAVCNVNMEIQVFAMVLFFANCHENRIEFAFTCSTKLFIFYLSIFFLFR